jgi:two-component system, response regulator PdtaR
MCKILIIEDERIIAEDLKYIITSFGHEVVGIAKSGDQAIMLVEQFKPEIILMDIMLEGDLNGIQTAQYISDRFDLQVIYITAYADRETMNEAFETNPYGFLQKPVQENQLYAAIEIADRQNKKLFI